jgi:hypothetical protein
MWRTSEGNRILRGAEWELFRAGLAVIWDEIEDCLVDDDSFSSGIAAFDNLQPNQKLALLASVGQALRDASVPMPELTAHCEATVAAVFECIWQSVELEMGLECDTGDPNALFWRQLVLAACREINETWEESLPAPDCDEPDVWEGLVDVLAERILWDSDFDMEEDFLDREPVSAEQKTKEMGIAREYYLKPAPEPTEVELSAIRTTLRELVRRD